MGNPIAHRARTHHPDSLNIHIRASHENVRVYHPHPAMPMWDSRYPRNIVQEEFLKKTEMKKVKGRSLLV